MAEHGHARGDGHAHAHHHGMVDPAVVATDRGIWAVKRSLIIMGVTGLLQLGVVAISGSVALLADSIHNVSDALTAIPLWFAFHLARRKPSSRFGYGYGRVEDLAGVAVVVAILASAAVAGYESIQRLLVPQPVQALGFVAAASVLGFLGNEIVARLRMRVGREIGSAALVADGQHARADALTSLAVLLGAAGVWLGYPLADPVIGLLIAAAIVKIAWDSGRPILGRLLDEMDPDLVRSMMHETSHVTGVSEVTGLRARWVGHRLNADVSFAVPPEASVESAHLVSMAVQHRLRRRWPQLTLVTTQVVPAGAATGSE
jgi:cation diffusion facilitator family transporter